MAGKIIVRGLETMCFVDPGKVEVFFMTLRYMPVNINTFI